MRVNALHLGDFLIKMLLKGLIPRHCKLAQQLQRGSQAIAKGKA
jgi:hypothetical protein